MAAEGRGEGTGSFRAVAALALRCCAAGKGSLMGSVRGVESCRGLSGTAQFRIAVVVGDGLRTLCR